MSAPEVPLTLAQESIYFLNDLTRGRPVYHMPMAFRILGPLDATALEGALRTMVRRHDALRTAIIETPDGPRQSPGEERFRLQRRKLGRGGLDNAIQARIAEPFRLGEGEVFRADLFETADDERVLLLNLHHILGDMTSLGILCQELGAAYSGRTLADPVTQNSAHAKKRREEPGDRETVEFWKAQLRDYGEELDLPLDRARPRLPSFAGGAVYRPLSPELTRGLKSLARTKRCSVYMLCLAALEILVFRSTGQERFCIATPFSEREDPSIERTIGYLVNLLPLPCEVRGDLSFDTVLAAVRGRTLEAFAHKAISLRELTAELGLIREHPKPPLTRFVFQYFPEMPTLELEGLRCERIPVHSGTSKFDLCFSLFESGEGLTVEVEYDTDLFRPESAALWSRHFETLLENLLKTPNAPVARLGMVSEEERRSIARWSGMETPFPRETPVHELFARVAAERRDAIALRSQEETWTYGELEGRANALANQLRNRGVRAGDFVGVCLDRSPGLIAALLGILKTGAAYVPFDSKYPKARIDYLFRDSHVRLLVTDSNHARIAPEGTEVLLLTTEAVDERAPESSADVGPESPAYLMYTSGSTGEPKGVIVPHRAIVRLVKNNDFARFSAEDVWLGFAPISFDASTLEIWAPLLNGGTLAMYPADFESVEQFERVLREYGVTSLWLTSGLFNTIVDQNARALAGVRQLLAGGEALSVAHVRKALEALPDTEIINGYGPTENTTFTCCYRIPRDFPGDRSIPIGRPIKNTRVRIVDANGELAAVGVPGELYAGGAGLSLGYLNQPELTAEKFFEWEGERWYRTGDRARFLPDGPIEFLGRRDTQVKIRGFRVELGEIEAALRRLPGVEDAAATVRPDSTGGNQLAGYVVGKESMDLDAHREALAQWLPAHACPATLVRLEHIPLGPNGKVDRKALPTPENPSGGSDGAKPADEIEAIIAQILGELLEIPAMGADDNFFHHGGESLRAMRAVSRLNREFDCRLTLAHIFEAPTVRGLARLVKSATPVSDAGVRQNGRSESGALPMAVDDLSDEEVDELLNQLVLADDADSPSRAKPL